MKEAACPEIIIHIPHSSLEIPPPYRDDFVVSGDALDSERLKITDLYTDELFACPDAIMQINTVSRLVMDPERFRDDAAESMAAIGMGAVYTHGSDGKLIRRVTEEQKQTILRTLYDTHHERLTQCVDKSLAEHGRCLIIDAHSFPSSPLPYEFVVGHPMTEGRPDICIGYDTFHVSAPFIDAVSRFFEEHRLTVARNQPYAGAIVPIKHDRRDPRVVSLMIEVNRKLYMDESTGEKIEGFERVRPMLQDFLVWVKTAVWI